MQDAPRLHLDPDTATLDTPGAVLPLAAAHAHYLGVVLRRQPGDPVQLFNHRDGEWEAVIEALRKDRGQVRLRARSRPPAPEPGPILVFAPLKRDATDTVVRMATELGAAELRPVFTERTVSHRINAERWHAIAVEAAEQCERLSVPTISSPTPLAVLLGAWDPCRPLLAALERSDATTTTPAAWCHAVPASTAQPAVLLGPEGGFSPAERALLLSRPFVVPVSLGPLVLRADTAAAAVLSSLRG